MLLHRARRGAAFFLLAAGTSRYLKKIDQFIVYRQSHNEIQQMKNLQKIRKLLTSKRQKFPPNSTPMEPTKLEAWERQLAVYVQATALRHTHARARMGTRVRFCVVLPAACPAFFGGLFGRTPFGNSRAHRPP